MKLVLVLLSVLFFNCIFVSSQDCVSTTFTDVNIPSNQNLFLKCLSMPISCSASYINCNATFEWNIEGSNSIILPSIQYGVNGGSATNCSAACTGSNMECVICGISSSSSSGTVPFTDCTWMEPFSEYYPFVFLTCASNTNCTAKSIDVSVCSDI